MKKMTVRDLLDTKGKRQLTQVAVYKELDAIAAAAAGIDMICAGRGPVLDEARRGAPDLFLTGGIPYGACSNESELLRAAFDVMGQGADAVYTYTTIEWTKAMADHQIPVVGHIGLIPHTCSWTGGFKAVGKTADQALDVYRHALAYQEAGAIGVELEVVPHKIAAEIAKRVDILMISMGSGPSDVQYLFAADICGTTRGHVPRHAKAYADLKAELDRIERLRAEALKAFKDEVDSGAFPPPDKVVEIEDEEFEKFMDQVDRVTP